MLLFGWCCLHLIYLCVSSSVRYSVFAMMTLQVWVYLSMSMRWSHLFVIWHISLTNAANIPPYIICCAPVRIEYGERHRPFTIPSAILSDKVWEKRFSRDLCQYVQASTSSSEHITLDYIYGAIGRPPSNFAIGWKESSKNWWASWTRCCMHLIFAANHSLCCPHP